MVDVPDPLWTCWMVYFPMHILPIFPIGMYAVCPFHPVLSNVISCPTLVLPAILNLSNHLICPLTQHTTVLFCSSLLCFVIHCSAFLYSSLLLCSILFYSALHCSPLLLCSMLFYSALLCSPLFCISLLFFALVCSWVVGITLTEADPTGR